MTGFRVRFPAGQIEHWASRFPDSDELPLELGIARIRRRRKLRKAELVRLARWKTPRSQKRVAKNAESFVEAATSTALTTSDERLRIEVLTLLDGVDWPTASVVLHFCHLDPYPILDVRAIWSLGVEKPSRYDFDFWWGYTSACRRLAQQTSCSMRTVDRALWQFSKERQE